MNPTTRSRPESPELRITRDELSAVVRRAAELYAGDTDASEEELSEAEVLRIAGELGLPARHVRQALYELPRERRGSGVVDRVFGEATAVVTRRIPNDPALSLRLLEDYLTTREYLQVRRRRPHSVGLAPADDLLSGLARRLRRPEGRFRLAHARRVLATARPLEPGWAHVRLDLDYGDKRRRMVAGGVGVGTIAGMFFGVGAAALVEGVVPGAMQTVGEVMAFGGGMVASVAAGVAAGAARFRRWITAARVEVHGLLDRLEHGERLDPPPSPWRRRLQRRFGRWSLGSG